MKLVGVSKQLRRTAQLCILKRFERGIRQLAAPILIERSLQPALLPMRGVEEREAVVDLLVGLERLHAFRGYLMSRRVVHKTRTHYD